MQTLLKGLILAQNERWRRGLGMQVARIPAMGEAAKGTVMRGYLPWVRDSRGKLRVIPDDVSETKGVIRPRRGLRAIS